jgi:MbtH protein
MGRESTSAPVERGVTILSWEDREDTTIYKVVVNHEEQYSIWPVDRENALGWNDAGKSGTKAERLEYIKEVWTDMRPLSLRKKMEEMARETKGEGE